ncbi:MAG: fumarylacetoacetate hydrolase family protein [Armatimonadetes bacterium]|nr:fumarylacetoacetate hydrolase family protein [Armatimonadota bacterium]
MELFRYLDPATNAAQIGIQTDSGERFNASAAAPEAFASIGAWLAQDDPIEAAVLAAKQGGVAVPDHVMLLAPVDESEVWASGVTYERSRSARREESQSTGGGDFYDRVYDADRPELFFKSAGWRVVAPGGDVRIRRDSVWNVPEPEMVLVVSRNGAIVGVTAGNDMSSRSIEGENPLYLPQAKTYDGACAIGATIVIAPDAASLRNRTIQLSIERGGETVYSSETSTTKMKRTPEELVGYLLHETAFPTGAFLFTGTGIVPPDDFTLAPGDVVSITVAGVTPLTNSVAA